MHIWSNLQQISRFLLWLFPRLSGLLFSVDWRTSIIDHTGERIILAVSWYVVVVCTPFINLPPPSLPDPPDLRSRDPDPIYSTPIRYTTLISVYWLSFGYEIWSDHAGIYYALTLRMHWRKQWRTNAVVKLSGVLQYEITRYENDLKYAIIL